MTTAPPSLGFPCGISEYSFAFCAAPNVLRGVQSGGVVNEGLPVTSLQECASTCGTGTGRNSNYFFVNSDTPGAPLCYCVDVVNEARASNAICDQPCPSQSGESCGGSNGYGVLYISNCFEPNPEPASTGYEYLGCFIGDYLTDGTSLASSGTDIGACANACKAAETSGNTTFKFFGLGPALDECSCFNQADPNGIKPAGRVCERPCSSHPDPRQFCGPYADTGFQAQNVFVLDGPAATDFTYAPTACAPATTTTTTTTTSTTTLTLVVVTQYVEASVTVTGSVTPVVTSTCATVDPPCGAPTTTTTTRYTSTATARTTVRAKPRTTTKHATVTKKCASSSSSRHHPARTAALTRRAQGSACSLVAPPPSTTEEATSTETSTLATGTTTRTVTTQTVTVTSVPPASTQCVTATRDTTQTIKNPKSVGNRGVNLAALRRSPPGRAGLPRIVIDPTTTTTTTTPCPTATSTVKKCTTTTITKTSTPPCVTTTKTSTVCAKTKHP